MIITKYKLFVESYEEIMQDMTKDVDVSKIDSFQKEIQKIKVNIEAKKKELETKLDNLEKLQVSTFTEENKKIVDAKKKEFTDTVAKLKDTITKYEADINDIKNKIAEFKK
jgi:hypothetical protein